MTQLVPNGLSESFEEYVVRCIATCYCPDKIKKYSVGAPEGNPKARFMSALPEQHIATCKMSDLYIVWKASNRAIYERIRPAVIEECNKLRLKDRI